MSFSPAYSPMPSSPSTVPSIQGPEILVPPPVKTYGICGKLNTDQLQAHVLSTLGISLVGSSWWRAGASGEDPRAGQGHRIERQQPRRSCGSPLLTIGITAPLGGLKQTKYDPHTLTGRRHREGTGVESHSW